jgi:hypothetical protein
MKGLSDARKIFRLVNWLNAVVKLINGPPPECNTLLLKVADRANQCCAAGS